MEHLAFELELSYDVVEFLESRVRRDLYYNKFCVGQLASFIKSVENRGIDAAYR